MNFRFQDREEAGRMLADKLGGYAGCGKVVVLGLPRGGIPVAYEVALRLGAPLDVFLVRKLGAPGHEELAVGAIASGGICYLNQGVIEKMGVSRETIESAVVRERRELERREAAYRARPSIILRDRVVLLVDDGLATGASMRAAAIAVARHQPEKVIVAVPVGERGTVEDFEREVAEIVCVQAPVDFEGVGQWYEDFAQTSDEEVRSLLAEARMRHSEMKTDR